MNYTGSCVPEVGTKLRNPHGERLRRQLTAMHEGALAVGKDPAEGSFAGRRCRPLPVRTAAEGPDVARPTDPTAGDGESRLRDPLRPGPQAGVRGTPINQLLYLHKAARRRVCQTVRPTWT